MNSLIGTAIKFVKKYSGKIGTGYAASFVPITEQLGVKFYYRKHPEYYATKTWELQKKAAEYGLAPNISEHFNFIYTSFDDVEHKAYGYITERIHIVAQSCVEKLAREFRGHYNYNDIYQEILRNRTQLIDNLTYIGMSPGDMHFENFGWTHDNRVVCIDFSHFNDWPIMWTGQDCGMLNCSHCRLAEENGFDDDDDDDDVSDCNCDSCRRARGEYEEENESWISE